jgi:hypothetical protein
VTIPRHIRRRRAACESGSSNEKVVARGACAAGFCGESSPEDTFKLEAHALPEALGNKSLTTTYECDACNQGFGRGIENDFGHW